MNVFEYKKVSEMAINDAIEGFYMIKKVEAKVSSNGKPFLTGTLGDMSGEIPFVMWGYNPDDDIPAKVNGGAAKIRGNVSEYNGAIQISLSNIRPTKADDKFDKSQLVPVAPIDVEGVTARIKDILSHNMTDKDYRKVCKAMLERHTQFLDIPAAKGMHHAFLHGLLMHTFFMLENANFISNMYLDVINKDLLLAGALCHDMAKEVEFMTNEFGIVTDYSVKGQLLGHLYMGAADIANVCEKLGIPEEKSMLLQHLILSHHGKPEFGACVVPKTPEAVALNMIDDLDAKMEMFREQWDTQAPGTMSEKANFGLGARVYRQSI